MVSSFARGCHGKLNPQEAAMRPYKLSKSSSVQRQDACSCACVTVVCECKHRILHATSVRWAGSQNTPLASHGEASLPGGRPGMEARAQALRPRRQPSHPGLAQAPSALPAAHSAPCRRLTAPLPARAGPPSRRCPQRAQLAVRAAGAAVRPALPARAATVRDAGRQGVLGHPALHQAALVVPPPVQRRLLGPPQQRGAAAALAQPHAGRSALRRHAQACQACRLEFGEQQQQDRRHGPCCLRCMLLPISPPDLARARRCSLHHTGAQRRCGAGQPRLALVRAQLQQLMQRQALQAGCQRGHIHRERLRSCTA